MTRKGTKGGFAAKPGLGPPVTADERLLLDVIDALRGADNLRERLLMALQAGTPAVADLAYAVKARVKEDYKVIEKIQDRRTGTEDRPPQPAYGVGDVTDLVGLRIVTLYRLDVLEVLEALLVTIDADRSSSAPFVAGSISEVIIYSTNPTGDVQNLPVRARELFEAYGLGSVTEVAEKPSNYSSIHILARGRGKYRDSYRELPVEIQVRTALEDVWGQIEHSLKYKRSRLRDANANSPETTRLATTLRHLGALKTMIDGIAQYGDQIKLQIDELEPELRSTATKIAEEVSARLGSLRDLPQETKAAIAAAVAVAKPALSGRQQSLEARITALRTALAKLEELAARDDLTAGFQPRTVRETRYILTMQRALVHFQLGNLLGGEGEHLQRANRLYAEAEGEFPRRLVVAYRLALTLDALGARSEAMSKMRAVVSRLEEASEPTPKNHWIRAAAPRNLGVMLWEEAKARREGIVEPDDEEGILRLLKEAYALTHKAHDIKVKEDPDSEQGASERVKAANNMLYFLLEYLEAGGAVEEGMDPAQVTAFLTEIGGNTPSQLTSLAAADTARRAHAFLENRALEKEAASTVIRLGSRAPTPRPVIVREALRAAERSLSQGGPGRLAPPAGATETEQSPPRPVEGEQDPK